MHWAPKLPFNMSEQFGRIVLKTVSFTELGSSSLAYCRRRLLSVNRVKHRSFWYAQVQYNEDHRFSPRFKESMLSRIVNWQLVSYSTDSTINLTVYTLSLIHI